MKNSKIFTPKITKFLKLSAVFVILACGPMPFDFGEYYSLFMPESSNSPQNSSKYHYSPLFFYGTGQDFYDYDAEQQAFVLNIDDSLNVESWIRYGGAGVTEQVLNNALFKQGNDKALTNILQKNGKNEAAQYVNFIQNVKNALPQAENYWEATPERNNAVLEKLYGEALQSAKASNDVFLKERYAFQAIKLAAELKKYEQVIKNYELLVLPIKQKTFISDWAWARHAGAVMALGDTAKSFYEFAQIFENCPSRREEADLSVRTKAASWGEKALSFCKNDKEKAAVYALSAIQPAQDGLALLKKIVAINPNHPMAELIMAREINKNEVGFFAQQNAENYMLGLDLADENYKTDANKVQAMQSKSLSYFEQLGEFSKSMAENSQIKDAAFWLTANAYIDYLKKDFSSAEKQLTEAKSKNTSNEALKQQILFQETLLISAQNQTFNQEVEGKILHQIEALNKTEDFRNNNMLVKLCSDLATQYGGSSLQATAPKESGWKSWLSGCSSKKTEQQQQPNGEVKAFLAKCIASQENENPFMAAGSKNALTDATNETLLQAIIGFVGGNSLTENDKLLIKLANIDTDYLNLALGKAFIKSQNYAKAAEAWKKVSTKVWSEEPFAENFDKKTFYLLGQNAEAKKYLSNPVSFMEEMATLKARTEKNANDAEAWYLLGCGEYNMSYHGNNWILTKRERSSTEFGAYSTANAENYYTTEVAKNYFDKAIKANPDAELAAKICYGGALCERNQYLLSYWKDYPQDYDEQKIKEYQAKAEASLLPKYRTFFSMLKDKYRNTAYEKMVLNECSTYENFVK